MRRSNFAIERYLARIAVAQPESTSVAVLRTLHRAHRAEIPFENLDIQLGRPIRLDIESLQAKLVDARRGGYCFEHNTLFLAALRALGFDVEPCEAREGTVHVLQLRGAEDWKDLYAFVPEPRFAVDFEVANWYTSTHPESIFVRTLTAQRSTPEARHVLRGLPYTRSTPSGDTTREITRDELVPFLADTFGIDLPADARFRALDGGG